LVMLWVGWASLAITLGREDWRRLLVLHLLLTWGRDGRVSRGRIRCTAIALNVSGRVAVMGLLVLCVVGHFEPGRPVRGPGYLGRTKRSSQHATTWGRRCLA